MKSTTLDLDIALRLPQQPTAIDLVEATEEVAVALRAIQTRKQQERTIFLVTFKTWASPGLYIFRELHHLIMIIWYERDIYTVMARYHCHGTPQEVEQGEIWELLLQFTRVSCGLDDSQSGR